MFDVKSLLEDIELQLEMQELKRLGLNEEEIAGYFEYYIESWIDRKIKKSMAPN